MNSTISLLLILIAISSNFAKADECPSSAPSNVALSTTIKTSFNQGTKLYRYDYTFKNLESAKTDIARIFLVVAGDSTSASTPAEWTKGFARATGSQPSFIRFSTLSKPLQPGKSLSGFSIWSPNPPGVIRVFSEGEIKEPLKAITLKGDDEATPDCPGYFQSNVSVLSEMTLNSSTGPVANHQLSLSALMKLKRPKSGSSEFEEVENPEISPLDEGKLQILLFGKEDLDLSLIKTDSIKLGPSQLRPVSTAIVPSNQLASWHGAVPNKGRVMLLEFDLSQLKLRCNVDRALFLSALTGDRSVLASVPIRPSICSPSNWARSKQNTQ